MTEEEYLEKYGKMTILNDDISVSCIGGKVLLLSFQEPESEHAFVLSLEFIIMDALIKYYHQAGEDWIKLRGSFLEKAIIECAVSEEIILGFGKRCALPDEETADLN